MVFQVYDGFVILNFLLICLYIFVYIVVQLLKQKNMKEIVVCYAVMLLLCVFAGVIAALTCCYSSWWALLFFFLLSSACIPYLKIRDEVPKHEDFATLLFVISFAVLCVGAMTITIRLNVESFLSVMVVASIWIALLLTVKLISLAQDNKLVKMWYKRKKSELKKKLALYQYAAFF